MGNQTKLFSEDNVTFSKLNWNNTDFVDQFSVTLSVSKTIAEILSETRAIEIKPSNQYKYYM